MSPQTTHLAKLKAILISCLHFSESSLENSQAHLLKNIHIKQLSALKKLREPLEHAILLA
jgi:hypothetical protein